MGKTKHVVEMGEKEKTAVHVLWIEVEVQRL